MVLSQSNVVKGCILGLCPYEIHYNDAMSFYPTHTPHWYAQIDVPKGCILALCPYEIHHDDAMFPPHADTYDPFREPMSLGDGTAIMPTVAGMPCAS